MLKLYQCAAWGSRQADPPWCSGVFWMCYRYVAVIAVFCGSLNYLCPVVNVIRSWNEVVRYRNATRHLGYRLKGECK